MLEDPHEDLEEKPPHHMIQNPHEDLEAIYPLYAQLDTGCYSKGQRQLSCF